MNELNPRDTNKLQKIYEDMLYRKFKKEKPVVVKEKEIKKPESPWDRIKEDKYL